MRALYFKEVERKRQGVKDCHNGYVQRHLIKTKSIHTHISLAMLTYLGHIWVSILDTMELETAMVRHYR